MVADVTGRFVAVLASRPPLLSPSRRRRVGGMGGGHPLTCRSWPGPAAPSLAGHEPVRRGARRAERRPSLRAALQAADPWDVLPGRRRSAVLLPHEPLDRTCGRRPATTDPGTPVMELGLLALLAVCARRHGRRSSTLPAAGSARAATAPGAADSRSSSGLLGLGYMAIEMALIQKFGMLLGHPNHALTVVLAALLLATGVGSLALGPDRQRGGRAAALRQPTRSRSCVAGGGVLLAFPRLRVLGRSVARGCARRWSSALVLPIGRAAGRSASRRVSSD